MNLNTTVSYVLGHTVRRCLLIYDRIDEGFKQGILVVRWVTIALALNNGSNVGEQVVVVVATRCRHATTVGGGGCAGRAASVRVARLIVCRVHDAGGGCRGGAGSV